MLYAFAKFMQFTRSRKEEEIDAHFVIISKYGIAASSLCLASFVLYILGCFFPNSDDFIAGTQGVFSILFLTLFQMKLALYHNDMNKDEIVQSRLENAIGKDQLSKIKERTLKRNATRGGASNSSIYIYNTQSLEHVESTLSKRVSDCNFYRAIKVIQFSFLLSKEREERIDAWQPNVNFVFVLNSKFGAASQTRHCFDGEGKRV
ncbi:hypothetical protein BCR33DRAFT_129147 [Rhizoclosmatium globosum]|uniref:Uncharacterized protein n=1 Tax=Rhizoclosmatium globosum TaxID=329046 RepID=A0A1Y2CHT0_9FUNG|nr:hypothetical protein BCR33DRAFT_129147 [Rhizoclosmatium globosum]|eukprot:ORY46467.1 hypothetical protein BCR33DRAFT_129147 [Rhizoclosmatium globosum]